MIYFDIVSNTVSNLNTDSMSFFLLVTTTLATIASVSPFAVALISYIKGLFSKRSWNTIVNSEDENIIPCLEADGNTMHDILDSGDFRGMRGAGFGLFTRIEGTMQVEEGFSVIDWCDDLSYSAEAIVVEEDVEVMEGDLDNILIEFCTLPANKVEDVAFTVIGLARTRAVQNNVLMAAALLLSFVLPVAAIIDNVVAMPATVQQLKADNRILKDEIEKVNRKNDLLINRSKSVALQVAFVHSTDAPVPMNIRS